MFQTSFLFSIIHLTLPVFCLFPFLCELLDDAIELLLRYPVPVPFGVFVSRYLLHVLFLLCILFLLLDYVFLKNGWPLKTFLDETDPLHDPDIV